jgi:hypothetical protein
MPMKLNSLIRLLSLSLLLVAPGALAQEAKSAEAQENRPIQVVMKNVTYHYTAPIAVHVVQLQGYLTPTKTGSVVIFDDYNSFVMHMTSAEIAISCDSLARVLNENVFSAANAPIKGITIENKNNQLDIKGKLHQKGDVSFEATGTLSVDADGRIRLHTEHVKAAHLPVKGIMDLLGIDLAQLINTKKVQGVAMEKDDVVLDPEQVFPPPRIQGKVTAVRLQGSEIVQVYGSQQATNFAAKVPGNFMAYREGNMRFDRLMMNDTDLILTDMDVRDPLDFYMEHYKEQIVAGYIKATPEFGLRVYIRDYGRLQSTSDRLARNAASKH